jgi:hypothetical protein
MHDPAIHKVTARAYSWQTSVHESFIKADIWTSSFYKVLLSEE